MRGLPHLQLSPAVAEQRGQQPHSVVPHVKIRLLQERQEEEDVVLRGGGGPKERAAEQAGEKPRAWRGLAP